MRYVVTYEVEVEADNSFDAEKKAREELVIDTEWQKAPMHVEYPAGHPGVDIVVKPK